ncbi:MAG: outer membrane lipoprotein-sorting protein [Bacteroidales bacterium]
MKATCKALITAAILVCGMAAYSHAQSADEILGKIDEITYAPKDQVSTTTITLIDKNGNQSMRKAEMKQKGRNMRFTRFTSPASQAGIAFLSLPDDVMYIYLPAFGRERRIASHVKNQSFAGTDFTYEDMEAVPYSEKFDPTLKETTEEYFVLELVPKPGVRSDYSRLVMQVDRDLFLPVHIDYYNRGNQMVKQMDVEYEKIQGYRAQKRIRMKDLEKEHITIMEVEEISFDNNLDDSEFSVRKLRQQ